MSTTFAVIVPESKYYETEQIDVAFRSNEIYFINPLARLLPDDLPVIPTDNSAQGIFTIGDIKKAIDG